MVPAARVGALVALSGIASCTLLNSLDRYQAGGPELRDGAPGRDGSLPDGGSVPGADGGGGGNDATTVPACDTKKPFGAPVLIDPLNTPREDVLSDLSADGLTAYLSTNRDGGGPPHLFYATRPKVDGAWSSDVQPLFPSGAWDDWGVTVNPIDGRTAIVSSDRVGGNADLYVATRNSPLEAFGALAPAVGPNSTADEEGPHWAANGQTLYFDSSRDGKRHLYRVPMTGSAFGATEAITELNGSDLEAVPVLSPDELTIYFLSGRAEPNGDIYVATRRSKAETFGDIKPVENVNSSDTDAPGAVSPDGCTLYFSSTRGGTGSFDVFVARRPPP